MRPILVMPIMAKDLDKEKCSNKFLAHLGVDIDPETLIYVKCDALGNINYRMKAKGRTEYRLYDVNKHEITEHIVKLVELS
jgi:hypothetical protein